MPRTRRIVVATVAGGLLALAPAASASAHVHAINPLRCTPAPGNAGANQTNTTPAAAVNGGPLSGVIPITMGGAVEPRPLDFFGVCRVMAP